MKASDWRIICIVGMALASTALFLAARSEEPKAVGRTELWLLPLEAAVVLAAWRGWAVPPWKSFRPTLGTLAQWMILVGLLYSGLSIAISGWTDVILNHRGMIDEWHVNTLAFGLAGIVYLGLAWWGIALGPSTSTDLRWGRLLVWGIVTLASHLTIVGLISFFRAGDVVVDLASVWEIPLVAFYVLWEIPWSRWWGSRSEKDRELA